MFFILMRTSEIFKCEKKADSRSIDSIKNDFTNTYYGHESVIATLSETFAVNLKNTYT